MKKFFTLIAAVAMAASVNAQAYSLAGKTSKDFYCEDEAFTFGTTEATQFDYVVPSKSNYSTLGLENTPIAFFYKNSSKKTKIFQICDEYLVAQGKGFQVNVDTKVGEIVTLTVGSKGSTAAAFAISSGATAKETIPTFEPKSGENPIEFKEIKLVATDEQVIVAETSGGFAIKEVKIEYSSGINSAISEVSADADAATYNVLGQKVASNAKGLVIKNGKKFINK